MIKFTSVAIVHANEVFFLYLVMTVSKFGTQIFQIYLLMQSALTLIIFTQNIAIDLRSIL